MKKTLFVYSIIILILTFYKPSERISAKPLTPENYRELLDKAQEIIEDQPGKAIEMLQDALQLIDKDEDPVAASRAYFLFGEACFYLDDLPEAIKNYLVAVDIDILSGNDQTPEHINILGNLGYMYDALIRNLLLLVFMKRP